MNQTRFQDDIKSLSFELLPSWTITQTDRQAHSCWWLHQYYDTGTGTLQLMKYILSAFYFHSNHEINPHAPGASFQNQAASPSPF